MTTFDESSVVSVQAPRRDFGQKPSYLEARTLKRELLQEQQARWDNDDPIPPEDLLARWPTDPVDDPHSIAVLYEDLLRHQQNDGELSIDDYAARFPAQREALAAVVNQQAAFQVTVGMSPRQNARLGLPSVGDEVFGFHLRGELGQGAFACVFLAEQESLADRPVVVKLSAIEGTEPQTLAQLQHTNIVPIYSVHEDPQAGIRAVCMPFFAGASLAQVLRELWQTVTLPTTGQQLVNALEIAQAPALATSRIVAAARNARVPDILDGVPGRKEFCQGGPETGPTRPSNVASDGETPRAKLCRMSYVRACVWIIARLAEGLEHAHSRCVLHRDVKPGNILFCGDGQPLLLDFNLSLDQVGDIAEATLGGTVSYMAPEHLQALISRTPSLAKKVDARSDIYSLGMVLHEMLLGHSPFDQSASYSAVPLQIEAMALERSHAAPSLKAQRDDIPWSLESIVHKSLAPDQTQRYQRAEHLAEDLQRFLDDRPLKYAPEMSWVEQVQKWSRRNPRVAQVAAVLSVSMLALLGIGTALVTASERLASTKAQLATVNEQDRQQAFEEGTLKALCFVNTVVPMQDHVADGLLKCEETLNLYGLLDGDSWIEPTDWSSLAPADRQRLAEDGRELLMLLAAARVQASPNDEPTLRSAVALLDRAASIPNLSPSKALSLDQARYWKQIGDEDRAAAATRRADAQPAQTARDHYLAATAYARAGGRAGFEQAIASLDESLRLEPRHYWSWVQRGFCHYELGDRLMAVADFGHSSGLWPEFAWGYFNRARVLDESGKKAEAVRDYSAALARDPKFVAAAVNRGLAQLELGRHEAALKDFDLAFSLGRSDDTLLASRGMALEGLGRHEAADAAFRPILEKVETLPATTRQRVLWAYGFAVSQRLPGAAKNAFESVVKGDPQNLQALYGLAMLAMQEDDSDRALECFNSALQTNPEFIEARRYRAILHARMKRLDRAGEDINRCLEREPNVGATLYVAACVAALAAEQIDEPQLKNQALDLLQRAIAQGVDPQKATTDPDLAAIRKHARFEGVLKAGGR